MPVQRTDRLNSLLKEVISFIIKRDVRNPHVTELVTVTRVQISKDLRHAKVFISIIGSEEQKIETMNALKTAAGFIAVNASKEVVMRYFPELTFKLDDSVDKHMRIEELLQQIQQEKQARPIFGDENSASDIGDSSTDSMDSPP
jgi:ribosome-binding factor A